MSEAAAIEMENLSKRYLLGGERYLALRDLLANPLRFFRHRREEIWALKELNLKIEAGEILGIIGRNGAGKSTLLKILARITRPTSGRVVLRGRVGSLLEVGTGFHAELTGRENIYFNGALLGMTKREIDRKLEEIVAFADIGPFLDTPLKRYSSGMVLRLAFSVAAHLDTEILLVDEILAVGDISFQKKCLAKMEEVSQRGRTVLFVSHQLATVEALCSRCLWLDRGRLRRYGPTHEVLEAYLKEALPQAQGEVRLGGIIKHARLRFYDEEGREQPFMAPGFDLEIEIAFEHEKPFRPNFGFVIHNLQGVNLLGLNNKIQGIEAPEMRAGLIRARLERLPMAVGNYIVDLWLGDGLHDMEHLASALSFEVIERDLWGSGRLPPPEIGVIYWPARWRFETAR